LHAPSPAVPALTPLELVVERVYIDRQSRRHAVHGDDEALAVRFTSGEKSEHVRAILSRLFYRDG
jgi:hypothetical protein